MMWLFNSPRHKSDIFGMLLDLIWIGIHMLIHPDICVIAEDDLSMDIKIICQSLQTPFNEHMSLSNNN